MIRNLFGDHHCDSRHVRTALLRQLADIRNALPDVIEPPVGPFNRYGRWTPRGRAFVWRCVDLLISGDGLRCGPSSSPASAVAT